MNISIIKRPSTWIPILMSLAALTTVFVHIAMFGIIHETDEGTTAHLFQILMAGQVPIIAFFAIRKFPNEPRQILIVLALQIIFAMVPIAVVLFLKL